MQKTPSTHWGGAEEAVARQLHAQHGSVQGATMQAHAHLHHAHGLWGVYVSRSLHIQAQKGGLCSGESM